MLGKKGLRKSNKSNFKYIVTEKTPVKFLVTRLFIIVVAGCFLQLVGCGQESSVDVPAPAVSAKQRVFEGTIAAMGDSLTEGLGVVESKAYPAQLERRLKAGGYDFQVINAGVSGETSSGAMSRIRWVVSTLKPDIVILETGANDGLRGIDPDILLRNLDQMVGILKQNSVEVVLAGMQMLPSLGPEYTRAFMRIYPAVAKKHDIILIPFFLEGVAGNPQLNQTDQLHPTEAGYQRIVETVYPYVVRSIDRFRSQH